MSSRPNRRRFLSTAAATAVVPLLAWPARAQMSPDEVDVAIVGAGAAGIAAARRIAASGRSYAVFEASARLGGRIWSDTGRLGVLHDRGAQRISASGRNPLVSLGRLAGLPLYEPTRFRRLQVGLREARDSEYDDFTAAVRRSQRAIAAAGEAGVDMPAARALPDLRDWRETVAFVLGPLSRSKDLDEISTVDFARAEDQPDELICRSGMSWLLATAAIPVSVKRDAAVTRVDSRGRDALTLDTERGAERARAVIVTVSTNVLAEERIRFDPPLGARTRNAIAALSLGTRDRLLFELPGNPFSLADDQRLVFKSESARMVALTGRVGGGDLAVADFSGRFGAGISREGEAAMKAFVSELLADHFGADARKRIGRSEAVHWSREPWILGGVSAAAPGQGASRRILGEPVHDRIFFAGEAVHESWFGTVAGAWVSGERAADQALAFLARPAASPAPARPAAKRRK